MEKLSHTKCSTALLPVRDALDVIHGKWKLLILIAVSSGNHRFKEMERAIPKITAKVLAKELRDLEENHLIIRTVYDTVPVLVEYTATPYAKTLQPVIQALHDWGLQHRKKIFGKK